MQDGHDIVLRRIIERADVNCDVYALQASFGLEHSIGNVASISLEVCAEIRADQLLHDFIERHGFDVDEVYSKQSVFFLSPGRGRYTTESMA